MTKKEKIEFTAKELFWKYGFKKVTVDEICKKSHVSRKTFYTYFKNKIDLVLYVLQQITEKAMEESYLILNGEGTFVEKLKITMTMKSELSKSLSKEFIADFFDVESKEIMDYYAKIMEEYMTFLSDFFRKAQETGEMNPDLNLNYVIWYLNKQKELMSSPELIAMFPDAETMTKQLTQSIIYGIMPVR